jgi:hypothetical protein
MRALLVTLVRLAPLRSVNAPAIPTTITNDATINSTSV